MALEHPHRACFRSTRLGRPEGESSRVRLPVFRENPILPLVRPWVGIPLCLDDRGRWRQGREYGYGDLAYARSVEAAGGVAVALPIQKNPSGLLDRIDALLLPGGDDLPAPAGRYPKDVPLDLAPETQLRFDTALLDAALERKLPVLGICYGAQLLALHHGGTLHHHLPIDLPAAGPHQLGDGEARHPLKLEPGSHLAQILGDAPDPVNSLHHQAVAEPGSGMRVCARADDGVIEAIEARHDGFCLGVQWHPEKLDAASSRAIFAAFIRAAENNGEKAPSPREG